MAAVKPRGEALERVQLVQHARRSPPHRVENRVENRVEIGRAEQAGRSTVALSPASAPRVSLQRGTRAGSRTGQTTKGAGAKSSEKKTPGAGSGRPEEKATPSRGEASNRRGSPEAIEKRRVARVFNDVLGGRGASTNKLDGRTEKRRLRLLKELETGKTRGARELKPLDVLQHVQELLELGEPLGAIRKVAKARKAPPMSDALVDLVARFHTAYGFRSEVYRFVGIGDDVLHAAGVVDAERKTKTSPTTGAESASSPADRRRTKR